MLDFGASTQSTSITPWDFSLIHKTWLSPEVRENRFQLHTRWANPWQSPEWWCVEVIIDTENDLTEMARKRVLSVFS